MKVFTYGTSALFQRGSKELPMSAIGCVASKDGRELTGPDLASVITQIDEEEDHTPPFGP